MWQTGSMTGRKDKRVEFHARSAEHKKQFEAKLKETGQTKSVQSTF